MRLTQMSDHEFAEYIKDCGASNNYEVVYGSDLNIWRNDVGSTIAVVVYDNARAERWIFIR